MPKKVKSHKSRKPSKSSKKKSKTKRPPNKWVVHCKAYAAKHKMKYGDAMKDPKCKSSYKAKK